MNESIGNPVCESSLIVLWPNSNSLVWTNPIDGSVMGTLYSLSLVYAWLLSPNHIEFIKKLLSLCRHTKVPLAKTMRANYAHYARGLHLYALWIMFAIMPFNKVPFLVPILSCQRIPSKETGCLQRFIILLALYCMMPLFDLTTNSTRPSPWGVGMV